MTLGLGGGGGCPVLDESPRGSVNGHTPHVLMCNKGRYLSTTASVQVSVCPQHPQEDTGLLISVSWTTVLILLWAVRAAVWCEVGFLWFVFMWRVSRLFDRQYGGIEFGGVSMCTGGGQQGEKRERMLSIIKDAGSLHSCYPCPLLIPNTQELIRTAWEIHKA